MTCASCGAPMRDDAPRCPSCGAAIRSEGWLGRMLRALGRRAPRTTTKTTVTVRTRRIEVKGPKTGETRVYHSLDEVPEAYRKSIEAALAAGRGGAPVKITVTDASGTTHTYDSVDQMPPEIRAIYERARTETTS